MNKQLLKDLFTAYASMAQLEERPKEIINSMNSLKQQIFNIIDEDVKIEVATEIVEKRRPKLQQLEEISQIIQDHKGGQLITALLNSLNVKKSTFLSELGMGSSNAVYLNYFLSGKRKISRKYAERFASWFEANGFYVPLEKLMD